MANEAHHVGTIKDAVPARLVPAARLLVFERPWWFYAKIMASLQPCMFEPPKLRGWDSYERTPTGEPEDGRYSKVGNWMGRLLRIPDSAEKFAEANWNEATLVNAKMRCMVDRETDLTWLYSSVGENVCYLAGRYNIESVEDLQARNPNAMGPRLGSHTKLVVVTGLRSFTDPNFDVRSLQANPRNCGATFQVASNFNGLEYKFSSENRKMGVARYVTDRTQGPSASESCGPATLYRNYFVDGNDYEQKSRVYRYDAQAMAKEVNTLDELQGLLPVVNGYVTFTQAPMQEDSKMLESDAYKSVKIVRHDFAQVTYGLRQRLPSGDEIMDVCNDPTQIVNQVFNAGINWVDMSHYVPNEDTRKTFAMFLSKASMISSLLAAQENRDALAEVPSCQGRNRFFPNLVGCGVFKNERQWLMDAWSSPEVFPYIQHSGLEIVVCFHAGNPDLQLEDQTAEAIEFGRQAMEGRISGFPGQTIEVEFVDASDHEAMAELFGTLLAQPTDVENLVADPALEGLIALERETEPPLEETFDYRRTAAERFAAESLAKQHGLTLQPAAQRDATHRGATGTLTAEGLAATQPADRDTHSTAKENVSHTVDVEKEADKEDPLRDGDGQSSYCAKWCNWCFKY